jgi:hypothetical protein
MYRLYTWLEKRYADVRKRQLLDKVEGYRHHALELQKEILAKNMEIRAALRKAESSEGIARNWMHRYNQLHDRHLNDARRESLGSLKFVSDEDMKHRHEIKAR